MGLPDRLADETATGERLVERLVRINGFTPKLRSRDAITLDFEGDAITPHRYVHIAYAGNSLVCFSCACRARFFARCMTAAQLALLLARNKEALLGNWQIAVEDGEVTASVHYTALTDGLNDLLFKVICQSLLGEVAFVEEALHTQGMLTA